MAFSRNGQSLACEKDYVQIWDVESGTILQTLETNINSIGIALLLNEEHLATWDSDGTVQMWDVPTRSLLRTFQGKIKGHSKSLAFSPVGQRLASGGGDGNVQIWDTAFNSPRSKKLQGHDHGIHFLVFSPNGKKLASVSERSVIRLWNVATGSLRKTLVDSVHTTSAIHISSVLFSVDGVKLVSFSNMGILDIWNTDSGRLLRQEDHSLIDLHTPTVNPSYGLNLIDRWITVSEKRLIRVPPDRQGSAFATHGTATYGTKVAIGSFSGVVTLLELDLELVESSIASPPNLEHGLETPSDVYASDIASEDDHQSSDIEDSEMEDSEVEDSEIFEIEIDETATTANRLRPIPENPQY